MKMGKKILAVVSSPRLGSNSEMLVDSFIRGAEEAGHEVEKLVLRDKKVAPCLGCEACLKNGGICVQKDDMADINRQILEADVIVLSTPTYYYSVSAQLKMLIDRTLANHGKMKNKEFYFIVTAADGDEAMDTVIADLNGFVACVPGSTVRGEVRGTAYGRREIAGSPALDRAYSLGKEC